MTVQPGGQQPNGRELSGGAIVAIADGRVVDVGSHGQLMAAKGFCTTFA